jgi:hypothetical protein
MGHSDPTARAHSTADWDFRGPAYDAQPGHSSPDGAERRAWLTALAPLLPPASVDVAAGPHVLWTLTGPGRAAE